MQYFAHPQIKGKIEKLDNISFDKKLMLILT